MVTISRMITQVNKKVVTGKVNQNIVVHYTGNKTDTAVANANYFLNVYRGASCQYVVDPGAIIQIVEDKDVSWGVGVNYGSNNLFGVVTNANSINIEMCSTNGKIAEETIQNTVDLVKMLMKKYNIPASNVFRHYDICSKKCPGWDGWLPPNESIWTRFKKLISKDSTTNATKASGSNQATSSSTKQTVATYRVRKSENDAKTQIGAYSSLDNAKSVAKANAGYKVYDLNGKLIYDPTPATTTKKGEEKGLFTFLVTCEDGLNIRRGPSKQYKVVGAVAKGEAFTIVEVSSNNKWGRLKSGAGWICVDAEFGKRK